MVGLFIGFAGGFMVGQRGEPLPTPQSAAEAPLPPPQALAAPQDSIESRVVDSPAARPLTPPVEPAPGATEATEVDIPPVELTPTVATREPEPVKRASVAQAASSVRSGSLQVVSRPPGAQVYVDDVGVGTTPLTVSGVSAGAHRVRLNLPGHRRWATSVDVKGGERARIGASLER